MWTSRVNRGRTFAVSIEVRVICIGFSYSFVGGLSRERPAGAAQEASRRRRSAEGEPGSAV